DCAAADRNYIDEAVLGDRDARKVARLELRRAEIRAAVGRARDAVIAVALAPGVINLVAVRARIEPVGGDVLLVGERRGRGVPRESALVGARGRAGERVGVELERLAVVGRHVERRRRLENRAFVEIAALPVGERAVAAVRGGEGAGGREGKAAVVRRRVGELLRDDDILSVGRNGDLRLAGESAVDDPRGSPGLASVPLLALFLRLLRPILLFRSGVGALEEQPRTLEQPLALRRRRRRLHFRRRRAERLEAGPRLQLLHLRIRGARVSGALQRHARLDRADLLLLPLACVWRHARVGANHEIAGRNRGGDEEKLLIVRFH